MEKTQTTNLLKCTCTGTQAAEYQDQKYGKGIRVHNTTKLNEQPKDRKSRCTVCGNVK